MTRAHITHFFPGMFPLFEWLLIGYCLAFSRKVYEISTKSNKGINMNENFGFIRDYISWEVYKF